MDKLMLNLKVSSSGVFKVLIKPKYFLLTILGVFFASSLILWSLNYNLLIYIFFDAPVTLLTKIDFFFGVYKDIFTTFTSIQALGIIIFSILFGVNLSLLIHALVNEGFKNIPKKSGLGGLVLAVVSGGCVACGTSLLTPLLATIGAASSAVLRDISLYLNWIASILLIYSIFKLGLLNSYIISKNKLNNEHS